LARSYGLPVLCALFYVLCWFERPGGGFGRGLGVDWGLKMREGSLGMGKEGGSGSDGGLSVHRVLRPS
jgi:hypothetical protein